MDPYYLQHIQDDRNNMTHTLRVKDTFYARDTVTDIWYDVTNKHKKTLLESELPKYIKKLLGNKSGKN
jgi:hypothetical protein